MVRIDPKTLKRQNMSCCTEQLAMATISLPWRVDRLTQLAMATSLLAMASSDSTHQFSSRGKHPFSLQNPNFDSLTPKFVPKVCLNVYELKKTIKTI
jgi:hypothetical protein